MPRVRLLLCSNTAVTLQDWWAASAYARGLQKKCRRDCRPDNFSRQRAQMLAQRIPHKSRLSSGSQATVTPTGPTVLPWCCNLRNFPIQLSRSAVGFASFCTLCCTWRTNCGPHGKSRAKGDNNDSRPVGPGCPCLSAVWKYCFFPKQDRVLPSFCGSGPVLAAA